MSFIRTKNMLIIVVIVYAVMTVVMLFTELSTMNTIVADVKSTVTLAADMALSQAMASDEFFNDRSTPPTTVGSNQLYVTKGVTTVQTAKTWNSNYTDENLFSLVYGLNDSISDNDALIAEKKALYAKMYGTDSKSILQNAEFMRWLCRVGTPMDLGSSVTNNTEGALLPNIARLGLLEGYVEGNGSAFLSNSSAKILRDAVGQVIGTTTTDSTDYNRYNITRDWLKLFSIAKTYTDGNGNEQTYFLAPTNVGVTYVDPYILQTAFVSNMDLIMREGTVASDHSDIGIPSNGFNGAGQTLNAAAMAKAQQQFIINDGQFAFVKGELKTYTSGDDVGGWTGGVTSINTRVVPEVSYRIVDMLDVINNDNKNLLMILHAAVGLPDSVMNAGTGSFSSQKAAYLEYLKEIGVLEETDSETSIGGKHHYIVLGEAVFFADVIVSYQSTIARDLFGMYQTGHTISDANEKSFFQVINTSSSLAGKDGYGFTSSITGNPYYMYATYFGVMP